MFRNAKYVLVFIAGYFTAYYVREKAIEQRVKDLMEGTHA